jgi:hypothetical protein
MSRAPGDQSHCDDPSDSRHPEAEPCREDARGAEVPSPPATSSTAIQSLVEANDTKDPHRAAASCAVPPTPIVFASSQTKRKLAHVATDEEGYHEFASLFCERFLAHYKRSKLGSMYWLSTPVPSPVAMDPAHELFATKATPEQWVAWQQLCQGTNVCILGPGGTGKSQFIRWVK